jgi:hypothetical protein
MLEYKLDFLILRSRISKRKENLVMKAERLAESEMNQLFFLPPPFDLPMRLGCVNKQNPFSKGRH